MFALSMELAFWRERLAVTAFLNILADAIVGRSEDESSRIPYFTLFDKVPVTWLLETTVYVESICMPEYVSLVPLPAFNILFPTTMHFVDETYIPCPVTVSMTLSAITALPLSAVIP